VNGGGGSKPKDPWGKYMMQKLVKLNKDERGRLAGLFNDAEEVWENELYRVGLYTEKAKTGENIIRLSIKGRLRDEKTGKPIEPGWSEKQEMKNQLVGANFEGVELLPAESRKTDQADHYHLWIVNDPKFRFPFGWLDRATLDDDVVGALVED
jgi:hypothetical protein